jgi:hypothetical protein
MKTMQRLTIKIEKHELRIAHFQKKVRIYCFDCRQETLHFTVSQLAELIVVPEIVIYRLCEANYFHTNETMNKKLFICANSIINLSGKSEKTNLKILK